MDFANLDLRTSASAQFWVHLRVGETMLYADDDKKKPIRVKVASITEPGVEAALKAVERAGRSCSALEAQLSTCDISDKKFLIKKADAAEAEAERCITNFLNTVIKDWENLKLGDERKEFSADALRDLSEPKAPMFRLATALSKDMAGLYDPFGKAVPA